MQTPVEPGGVPSGDDVHDDPVDYLEPPLPPDEGEDEPEDEPVEAEEAEPQLQAPQPRRPGRREREAARTRAAQEENQRLRDEIAQIRQQVQQYRPPGPDPAELARREQAEREHVAQMDYGQQIEYWRQKDRRDLQQQMQQQTMSMSQLIDKTNWDNVARGDPVRSRFSAQIDQFVQSELAAGRVPPNREIVYWALLGQQTELARQNRAANGSRQAARRVAAQQTRPSGVRSDSGGGGPPGRRPAADSYEAALERIKGQPIW